VAAPDLQDVVVGLHVKDADRPRQPFGWPVPAQGDLYRMRLGWAAVTRSTGRRDVPTGSA
jgi:hypothetical protein